MWGSHGGLSMALCLSPLPYPLQPHLCVVWKWYVSVSLSVNTRTPRVTTHTHAHTRTHTAHCYTHTRPTHTHTTRTTAHHTHTLPLHTLHTHTHGGWCLRLRYSPTNEGVGGWGPPRPHPGSRLRWNIHACQQHICSLLISYILLYAYSCGMWLCGLHTHTHTHTLPTTIINGQDSQVWW